jgi:predicted amidohydrolase YtcJ
MRLTAEEAKDAQKSRILAQRPSRKISPERGKIIRSECLTKLLLAIPILAVIAVPNAQTDSPPDLILHHARVYTVDDMQPNAEAIAIRGDRIAAVGSSAVILRLKGSSTRVIDVQGATILPGLQDAHGHFTSLGDSLRTLDLRGTTSYDQIVEMVRRRADRAQPGEWILGRNWDQNDWADKRFPTHEKLDTAAPNNPVYLTRVDGHAGLANRTAMQQAGLTTAVKDPDGGRIVRSASGDPTGVLVDRAQELVARAIPPVSREQLEEQILAADAECRRLGLTMVHDAGTNAATVEAYKRLIDAGRLQTRLYVMRRGSLDELSPAFANGPINDFHNHHLMVRAIKIVADGALGSRGAALLEPYQDEPGNVGLLTMSPEDVYAQTLAASKAGFQTAIHAIGDRANRMVLDVFERVQQEVPESRALRMRDEHAQILDAADIPRFAKLKVIASMQATHATSDMPWVPARLGVQRTVEGAYVWRKLMTTGALIANGSDFPVEEPNPMFGLYAAVTRQDRTGHPAGGWAPDERMSREEALRSFTINAAYAAHQETILGSITQGKLADLIVVSKDVMRVPPREILTTTVTTTIVGGRVVYERNATR